MKNLSEIKEVLGNYGLNYVEYHLPLTSERGYNSDAIKRTLNGMCVWLPGSHFTFINGLDSHDMWMQSPRGEWRHETLSTERMLFIMNTGLLWMMHDSSAFAFDLDDVDFDVLRPIFSLTHIKRRGGKNVKK